MLDHPFGSAAHQDLGENPLAAGSHDDEITIPFFCRLNDRFSRRSAFY